MFRIGIIGTENSHALAFAKLINLPDPATGQPRYPDARVVMVYGPEEGPARKVMEEGQVPRLVDTPADFMGNVDSMMVTSRRGSVHYEYALPFVEAGIPLFIDKPLTSDPEQAMELVALAEKQDVPVMGGSGCKHAGDVLDLAETARQWRQQGNLLSGSINFAADMDSEYDGFYFYSSHLVEMALGIFGSDIQEVQASARGGSVLVRAGYPDFDAALHFTRGSHGSDCTLYGREQSVHRAIDISGIYDKEVEHFIAMLRTGQMPQPYEALVLPVRIIAAILASLDTGRPEQI